ncbi:ATPase [Novosphingobium sp. FSY-8]|uniref:ATP synthase subunit b n=1 Tax=Novosphingobium ovatum TaxID=1908523 RepID=A0ABW9XBK1_9SPHN|nr:ATPase [Novosphingobium ovatum]NBC35904.1 ATPase [Novosphingobium ovatum]
MPQISQLSETYASQIFWALIFFGFVFFVIGRGMVPKVMATVASRDKQIADDLAAAEAARRAADEADAKWKGEAADQRANAQAVIAAAKADAAKAAEARLAAAGATIDARLAEADARIATARQGALAEIETVASEAAGDIVARLAGISVDAGAARAAVKEVLHG